MSIESKANSKYTKNKTRDHTGSPLSEISTSSLAPPGGWQTPPRSDLHRLIFFWYFSKNRDKFDSRIRLPYFRFLFLFSIFDSTFDFRLDFRFHFRLENMGYNGGQNESGVYRAESREMDYFRSIFACRRVVYIVSCFKSRVTYTVSCNPKCLDWGIEPRIIGIFWICVGGWITWLLAG